jgi:hypothetical protein
MKKFSANVAPLESQSVFIRAMIGQFQAAESLLILAILQV